MAADIRDRHVSGQLLLERPHHAAMPVRMALIVIVVEVLLAGAARADHLWWMQP
jgi:hypothetical protein